MTTLATARLLVSTLLLISDRSPHIACLHARADSIAEWTAASATRHDVPPGLLLAIGFVESHLGCHPASGGCWGAPINRRQRHVAGTPDHAARALARSYTVCGSWVGAVRRFRIGLCQGTPATEDYVRRAFHLATRLYARAGIALPPELVYSRNPNVPSVRRPH